jgi:signal transduction histidine kinase
LGAATAVAFDRVGSGGEWVVIAILVPLLFARMTIQGAKAQEELSEKIQRQQEALLTATETVFHERELERARIAEHIHDSSLQMLAAAAYGCSNTAALLDAGKTERAKETLSSADEAIHTAIAALRESLVDLRRASVEEGGLMTTVTKFVDQLSVLWAAKIEVEGEISHEPPIPVALAAFQILQEGVVNALKHSNGDQIVVRITEDESHMVHLVVEDEGPGFDPGQHVESDHVGMLLMKERAEGVGGEIKLHSAPGRGTRLEAILPAGVKVA